SRLLDELSYKEYGRAFHLSIAGRVNWPDRRRHLLFPTPRERVGAARGSSLSGAVVVTRLLIAATASLSRLPVPTANLTRLASDASSAVPFRELRHRGWSLVRGLDLQSSQT